MGSTLHPTFARLAISEQKEELLDNLNDLLPDQKLVHSTLRGVRAANSARWIVTLREVF